MSFEVVVEYTVSNLICRCVFGAENAECTTPKSAHYHKVHFLVLILAIIVHHFRTIRLWTNDANSNPELQVPATRFGVCYAQPLDNLCHAEAGDFYCYSAQSNNSKIMQLTSTNLRAEFLYLS